MPDPVPTEPLPTAPPPAPAPGPTDPLPVSQPTPVEPVKPTTPSQPEHPVDYAALKASDALKAPELVEDIRKLAAEHKVPLAAAQGVLDALGKVASAEAEGYAAQREAWAAEIAADKDFGGAKLDATRASVSSFLDTYGTPELRKLLTDTGLGDHPLLIKALAKAGKDAGEAPIVPGHGGAPVDVLRLMYPNSPQLFSN